MAEAIPFATSAIGGLFGPLGAQVGWMVGASILGSINRQKATPVSGDPNQRPNLQDIRGQNIPVIFGTVRAPMVMIWQDNFNAKKQKRKVGRGKEKQKQEYYEYFWNLGFHMGMATTPYRLVGLWEGAQRVQDDSLISVTMADGSTYRPSATIERNAELNRVVIHGPRGVTIKEAENIKKGVELSYDDAWFFGAHPRTDFTALGFYAIQNAIPAPLLRWPHNIWLSFANLSLGENPRVPDLTAEISPILPPTYSGAYFQTLVGLPDSGSGSVAKIPAGLVIGGRYCAFYNKNIGEFAIIVASTLGGDAIVTRTAAQILTDFPVISPGVASDIIGAQMVPGTNALMVAFSGNGGVGEQYLCCVFYMVDPDTGALEPAGSIRGKNNNADWWANVLTCGLDAKQSRFFIVGNEIAGSGSTTQVVTAAFPPSNGSGAVSIDWVTGGSNRFDLGVGSGLGESSRTYGAVTPGDGNFGFILPNASEGQANFFGYVSRARIRWNNANPGLANSFITANAATHPNGFVFSVKITAPSTIGAPVIENANFDTNGPPFDNEAENANGSAADSWVAAGPGYTERFFIGPSDIARPTSPWVVTFHRWLSDATNSTNGVRSGLRAFAYDPLAGEFEYIAERDFEMEDTSLEMPVLAGRFTGTDFDAGIAFDPGTGRLYKLATHNSSTLGWLKSAYLGQILLGAIDYTPPEIVRLIWTDTVVGFGHPASTIDTTTYDAAVKYCQDNGIFVSGIIYPQSRNEIFESLAEIFGGSISWNGFVLKFSNPRRGVVTPVDTLSSADLREDNPENPRPKISASKTALQETSNRVTVQYIDRSLGYRVSEVTAQDEVDQDLNGVRARTVQTGLIMSRETAARLADRLLWHNIYSRTVLTDLPIGWTKMALEPGDYVQIEEPDGSFSGLFRIVRKVETDRGKANITLVEELTYLNEQRPIFEDSRPTARRLSAAAEPPLDFEMYELPSEFSPSGPQYYVGWAAAGPSAGAGLYTSASTVNFRLNQSVVPYPDGGYLLTALPASPDALTNVDLALSVRSTSNTSSPTFWLPGEIMEDYSALDRASGLSWLRVGSEIISYERATIVSTNTWRLQKVFRGVGGTSVSCHGPGSVWWAHDPSDVGGLFRIPFTQALVGTTIYYKTVPVGFDNVEVDPSSVPYKSYTLRGTHFAPAAMNDIRVLVGSPAITMPASLPVAQDYFGTTSLFHIGPHARNVGSGPERNVTLVWPETSRTSGYGIGGYGNYGYGYFSNDDLPLSWRVSVVGSGGATVRNAVVSSPFYSYDALTNASDNGTWRGNLSFSVTPINAVADAAFAATRVVSLGG